jgi:superfamily II DNA or RNA helicase
MMDIYVSNDIRITGNIPNDLYDEIKQWLTFDNPAYERALKFGYGVGHIPAKILLYRWKGDNLILPRGIARNLISYLKRHQIPYKLHDKRVLLPKMDFQSNIQLRDYQQIAVEQMLKGTQGFLVAPCGSGKTIMMIEMMTRIKQPTLFIVHQKELMEQIINTAIQWTDVTKDEIGIIGAGKKHIGERMTVATIQTLNRMNLSEITDKFGAVFIDEAHHVAAKSFYNVISKFRGCYRLAVSATPDRADGLSGMVYACTGPIVHEVKQDHVPTIIPSLRIVRTNFSCASTDYRDITKRLMMDKERNRLIVETIKKEVGGNNYCLVLSDRVEHLKLLKNMLMQDMPHIRCEIVTGSTSKAKREEIMNLAKEKQIDVLMATQLAREGLDIPHLNRLFLTFPKKSPTSVQQEVGRIMRPSPGKTDAIVYDFFDCQNGILIHQFKKRKAVYTKLGVKRIS